MKSQRREQILEAAIQVFSRKGYHNTSIHDIIERAGIARGTFYLYFENKRQIFDTILDQFLEDLDAAVQTVRLDPEAPPPLEQVRANLIRVLRLLLEHPARSRILFHHAVSLDEEADQRLARFYEGLKRRIQASLETGIRMGLVRPCHVEVVSACILGSLKQVIEDQVAPRPGGTSMAPLPMETLVEEILIFGLQGVMTEGWMETRWPPEASPGPTPRIPSGAPAPAGDSDAR